MHAYISLVLYVKHIVSDRRCANLSVGGVCVDEPKTCTVQQSFNVLYSSLGYVL